ncbi:MAG TPA: hypothetical protein VIT62_03865 [Lysobacter sp.]
MSDPVPRSPDESTRPYALSLMTGGPLYRLLARLHLSDPALGLLQRRTLAILAITWLPLLILSILEGHAWDGVGVPFLKHIGAQVRLLVSLPLLIAAEAIIHQRMRDSIPMFVARGLVDGPKREQFASAITSARRWLDSMPAELVLLALVYAFTLGGALPQVATLTVDSWHGKIRDGHHVLTMAGWWGALVSLPLYQLLMVRWYFRLLIWWRFLWQVSKIELNLEPLHADRMGGLGFLSRLGSAFVPLLLAQGAMVSGVIADQIFYVGASLTDFQVEIVAISVAMTLFVTGPLCVFTPNLSRAKQIGLLKHEELSMQYARRFDHKWLSGSAPDEPLLGNSDAQTLADLDSSYESVRAMHLIPIDKSTLVKLLIAVPVPMLPLLLTMFSFKDLVVRVVSILF